jgi:bifunctional DNase/RNase
MVKLNVLGISYSQTQSGAYALILTEENGERRIPIIVGGFEAQSIAIELEGLKPPRPLTHDLFMNFAKVFGITIKEVVIYKLEEGVFYSQLQCDNGAENITIDARTSDAIALALRFKCPIYTTEEIIAKAGIVLDFDKENAGTPVTGVTDKIHAPSPSSHTSTEFKAYSLEELNEILDEAIGNEDYERASKIRDEINLRKKI